MVQKPIYFNLAFAFCMKYTRRKSFLLDLCCVDIYRLCNCLEAKKRGFISEK